MYARRAFRSFLRFAVEAGALDEVPAAALKTSKVPTAPERTPGQLEWQAQPCASDLIDERVESDRDRSLGGCCDCSGDDGALHRCSPRRCRTDLPILRSRPSGGPSTQAAPVLRNRARVHCVLPTLPQGHRIQRSVVPVPGLTKRRHRSGPRTRQRRSETGVVAVTAGPVCHGAHYTITDRVRWPSSTPLSGARPGLRYRMRADVTSVRLVEGGGSIKWLDNGTYCGQRVVAREL